jgi:hypothetical protein
MGGLQVANHPNPKIREDVNSFILFYFTEGFFSFSLFSPEFPRKEFWVDGLTVEKLKLGLTALTGDGGTQSTSAIHVSNPHQQQVWLNPTAVEIVGTLINPSLKVWNESAAYETYEKQATKHEQN